MIDENAMRTLIVGSRHFVNLFVITINAPQAGS
jgi:hypothetical protein